jgi:general secretion pathway protein E
MSDPIRKQILHHAEATELQRVALGAGMRPMFQDGIEKAAAGVTTIEEVLRVTREVE